MNYIAHIKLCDITYIVTAHFLIGGAWRENDLEPSMRNFDMADLFCGEQDNKGGDTKEERKAAMEGGSTIALSVNKAMVSLSA